MTWENRNEIITMEFGISKHFQIFEFQLGSLVLNQDLGIRVEKLAQKMSKCRDIQAFFCLDGFHPSSLIFHPTKFRGKVSKCMAVDIQPRRLRCDWNL